MVISPLRYSGGKSRLYKKIKTYFPKNKNVMIDVFFGGGSVGLNWLLEDKRHLLIANDIDYNLMNFWWFVKYSKNSSWNEFKYLTKSIDDTKKYFYGNDDYNPISFLIKNKCSFNGLENWSNLAFKQNFNESTFLRIDKCNILLKGRSCIYNEDYKFIFNLLNNDIDKMYNSFFYFDPPYLIKNAKKLYKCGNFDHYKFKEIIEKSNLYWVLSINDCDEIRKIYKNFNIYEIDAVYTSSNNKRNKCKIVKELVITNFIKD